MSTRLTLDMVFLRICVSAWYRRYLIVIPILIMPWIGLGIGMVMPKNFSARMTLLVQEPTSFNPFLDELAIPTEIKDRMDALVAQMRMRTTVEEIARSLGWINDESSEEAVEKAVEKLRDQVKAKLFGKEVVEISYKSTGPEGMSEILMAFAKHFTAKLLAPSRSAVSESERFLGGELANYQEKLTDAEDRLANFKSENADNLPALHMENVRRLTAIRQLISEKASSLSGYQARLATTRATLVQTNPIAGKLDERIIELQAELSLLRSRYTDQHSAIQANLHELEQLRDERKKLITATRKLLDADLDSLWNMVSSYASETAPVLIGQLELMQEVAGLIDKLEHELEALREEEKILAERVHDFGKIEREIARLERDAVSKRQLVDKLSQRFEMAKITSALGTFTTPEMVRIIDQPKDPVTPSSLPLIVYVIAGVAGGISIGIGLAFTMEILETRITNIEQIETAAQAPVICRIPVLAAPAPLFDPPKTERFSITRILRHARAENTA